MRGPTEPEDTPEDGVVSEEWARKHGYDREMVAKNMKQKNYQDARARGESVMLDEPDPIVKFEFFRSKAELKDSLVYVQRVWPDPTTGIPPIRLRALRDGWGDLINYLRPHWSGGNASFKWIIMNAGKSVAGADFQLSGENDSEDEMPKKTETQAQQPAPAQAPQPVWDGYRWVLPQSPPSPGYGAPPGYSTPSYQPPPGYQLVPVGQVQAHYPPPPPPPQPQAGDTAETLALRYQVMLKEHELKVKDMQLEQERQRAAVAPAQPQVDPFVAAMRDPTYMRWYYTQGPGREQLGAPPPAATAHAEPPKTLFQQAEEGAEYLKRANALSRSIAKDFAPDKPPDPPKPEPNRSDDDHPLVVKTIGEVSIPAMRDTGEVPAGLFAAANLPLIENKLSKGFDKVMEALKEQKKTKLEMIDAERQKLREEEDAAARQRHAVAEQNEDERRRQEDHFRKLSQIKAEEEERVAKRIIEEARRPAPPPEPKDLGTLGTRRPVAAPENGTVDLEPATDPPCPEEPKEQPQN